MNELALFAGAGGGLLGSRLLGWRTVCAVEIDPYCWRVLMRRQNDGMLDPFPVWDDVRTFDGHDWRGRVDVVTAGFPCQPFSVAGQQRGADDERNMWPETIRIIRQVEPHYCLLENVPALVYCGYIGTVLGDLATSGFDAEWCMLSAAGGGAPHLRKRLWVLGKKVSHAIRTEFEPRTGGWRIRESHTHVADTQRCKKQCGAGTVRERPAEISDTIGPRLEIEQRQPGDDGEELSPFERACNAGAWWEAEPDVGRVVDGLAHRVDRLRSLGNGQVPAVVVRAWNVLRKRIEI